MEQADLRSILEQVASGTISADAAQALLNPPEDRPTVARLAIRSNAVRLTVVADPSVDTAVADGPHRVEHDGDRLIIHSDLSRGEYASETPRSSFMTWVEAGLRAGAPLRVRVNPALPLDVLTVAGSLELSGHQAPVAVGVEMGSARVSGGRGPLKLKVSTGTADVVWQFTGTSSVAAEMGSTQVTVLPGSDVVVSVDSSMGSAQLKTTAGGGSVAGESTTSVTVGNGAGTLAVTAKLGTAAVTLA